MVSRRRFNQLAAYFSLGSLIPSGVSQLFNFSTNEAEIQEKFKTLLSILDPEIELLVPTYLGNDQRRFYGRGVPENLKEIHKFPLGTGVTYVGRTRKVWSGAGWTGQPTITRDRGKTYLIIGAFDHYLRKIELDTQKEIWRYKFDDVVKGTSSIYIDETATDENQIVVLQGSRSSMSKGGLATSFRAISFRTGKEIWKLDLRPTPSYSRDNDSSPLYLGDGVIFNAGENAIGYFLNSSAKTAEKKSGFLQPKILSEVQLYQDGDSSRHGGNLVSESSPSRLDNRIFMASGSGHIYGIDIKNRKIIWDFYTGSDIDGSAVISQDGKLFCAIEKQYIPGNGGVLKLNPNKNPQDSLEWFLPTKNQKFNTWDGGIIGSVALNDEYNPDGFPAIFATNAIDGYLYIGSQMITTDKTVTGPLGKGEYKTPLILVQEKIGASISTPIFTDGYKLVTAGYNGVYLFNLYWEEARANQSNAIPNQRGEYYRLRVEEKGRFKPEVSFESTPVVWNNQVMICGRDGGLYTLG